MEKKAGHTVLFYMERVLNDGKGMKYANVQTDWIQFSNALAAAIDMRTVFEGAPSGFNAHGFVPRGGGRPDPSEQQSRARSATAATVHTWMAGHCATFTTTFRRLGRERYWISRSTRGGSIERE